MKAITAIIALLVCGLLGAQPKPVKAKLDKVTVYLSGANLYYSENVSLAAGTNEIVFENISPNINASSIQASSKAGVVMDVRYELNYEEKEKPAATRKYDKEIQNVLDSLDDLVYEEKDIDNKLRAFNTEKTMLLNNRIVKGDPLRDSLQLLEKGMELVRRKLTEIDEQILKLDRAKGKLLKKRAKLNERYNALLLLQSGEYDPNNDEEAQPKHQVIVSVYAEAATSTTINFSYFTPGAYWTPSYNLQGASADKNLELQYFASVVQNTGIDWKNTKLTISTSSPTVNNMKPVLSPWHLSFYEYRQKMPSAGSLSNATIPLKKETITFGENNATDETDYNWDLPDFITVTENLIRTEYEIKLNHTINSDGLAHKVLINERKVPMALEFAAVPKVSNDAFLLAKITGWEDMNIIPGQARVFFDNSYVGEVYLDAMATEDTLYVNMGRDQSIAVTRKKVKEKYKEKFFEGDKVETRSIEIMVRNTKGVTIDIEIEDQIPIAVGTNEIKVTLVDGDGAEHDVPTGSLKWKLTLKSKETKKLKFTYEIRYPKDKPLAGL